MIHIGSNRSTLLKWLWIVSVVFLSSCATKKDIVYFQNAKNFETIVDTDSFTPRLKVNDIVSIYVSTYDMEASRPFNLVMQLGGTGGQLIDYLIDIEGNIDFPVLGKIKLLGLTIEEAKELIKQKLAEGYLKDPIVNIRIQNFRITVLGAVGNAGTYPISGERVTLMEALALAGDLSIQGRRDNVLIIRDFNGTKTYTRVDLTNKEIFNSPVYYLTQNDVVYVTPNNAAISSASGDARIGLISSIIGLAVTIAVLLTR